VSVTPRYASISDWVALSGVSRSVTYEMLGRGELRAVKLGVKTLIDVEHGLVHIASLPPADISVGRNPVRRARDASPPDHQPRRRGRPRKHAASAPSDPAPIAAAASD
jgi:hypothetical protein